MGLFSGLFGRSYMREGPGVSKDEPQKPPFLRFFQLYFRKFWKLIQLNLLFMIPALIVAAMVFFLYAGSFRVNFELSGNRVSMDLWKSYVAPIPIILIFPFFAGLAYVTRNYVREEHAFVFSDFKDAIKDNWKFFLLNGCICYVCYLILSLGMRFYYAMMSTNKIMTIPFGLSLLFAMLFIFAQFYIPVMAITFELKFRDIYKNAFIFAILGLWRNFLLVILFAVTIFCMVFISPIMMLLQLLLLIFIVCLMFSTGMYTVNFVVYPMIEKYLLKPYLEKDEPKEEGEEASAENTPKTGDTIDTMELPKPEYVYVNGRLIRRDELEEEQVFSDE